MELPRDDKTRLTLVGKIPFLPTATVADE
ncbi:hypothetical protein CDAR_189251, partial [Caerostris darwini]